MSESLIPSASQVSLDKPEAITSFGRFPITRELGRGAIGIVYLGHDPAIDRAVAIKTFSPKLSAAVRMQCEIQFTNEARAAGRLSHPNIVTIFETSREGNSYYIVMEYLEGIELGKLLKGGKKFTYDEVAGIIFKLTDALAYMHKRGVIHRDLKPDHVFLEPGNIPKIMDFGIARSPNRISDPTADQGDPYTLYAGKPLGTPYYMSPEQATGNDLDLRTDIYSLGAIMFELLVGAKPFTAANKDLAQLLDQIAHKAAPIPHEVNPAIPKSLSDIVAKAMSKRPEKRYQFAEEMSLDLRRYMARERRSRKQARIGGKPPVPVEQRRAVVEVQPERNIVSKGIGAIAGLFGRKT
ncbi:hypothetical protein BH11PSE11_BH11PSE11_22820 [soil metagenome]